MAARLLGTTKAHPRPHEGATDTTIAAAAAMTIAAAAAMTIAAEVGPHQPPPQHERMKHFKACSSLSFSNFKPCPSPPFL